MVPSFNGAKYVSLGEKSTIKQINDIGDVLREEIVYHGVGDVTMLKGLDNCSNEHTNLYKLQNLRSKS